MRKIPTLYTRDVEDRRYVTDRVTPGCEWVLAGEGVPTRKYDGTCVMLDEHGQWWARREVKRDKVEPVGFVEVNYDPITGKRMGWEPAGQSPFTKFLDEAIEPGDLYGPGTYELVGPKINGNPERVNKHWLVSHETAMRADTGGWGALSPKSLVLEVAARGWEGIVWHHPDGRMAKLKVRDYPA